MNYQSPAVALDSGIASYSVEFPTAYPDIETGMVSAYLTDLRGKIITSILVEILNLTEDGFDVEFSVQIPSSGYFLRYLIADSIPDCESAEEEVTLDGEYDLGTVVYLDSWDGIENITLNINGVPPSESVDTASMVFKRGSTSGAVGMTLESPADIDIIDDVNWEFRVNPIAELPLTPGIWYYSFKTVDNAGFRKTWFWGALKIINV